MKRRAALVGIALLSAGGALSAQQPRKVARVGVLRPGTAQEPSWVQREPFERGLRELGWVPSSTVVIDYRYAEGDAARLPALAAELVSKAVDVVVVAGAPAAHAVRAASPKVPIVMAASNDAVAEGLAANLARPGRNITGIDILAFDMESKRLELLKEAFPRIGNVALIANPTGEPAAYRKRIEEFRASAQRMKVETQIFEISNAKELALALGAIQRGRFDALMVRPEPRIMDSHRDQIIAVAARLKLPAIYAFRFYAEAGGLISYGESIPAFHYRSASYVSRILRGADASELPMERPTKFELIVNLRTAKALGLQIPRAIVFRADEVIQ